MGGSSSEREVSLVSGRGVCEALKRRGYDVMPLDIKDENDAPRLLNAAGVEVVFIALHGGFGEDGTVQKILEDMKMPYTGSGWQASALAMDKIKSKKVMEEKGIPTPPYRTFKNNEYPSSLCGLSLPLIVKPSRQGSSIGVSMVAESDGLKDGLKKAYAFDFEVVVEEYIDGREIHIGILDDKPLPVVEVVPKSKFYDYQAKYEDGSTEYLVPAAIDKDVYLRAQALAIRTHNALGCCFFSRVDMRLSADNRLFTLEVNTIPGLTAQSLLPKAAKSAGITFEDLCEKILNSARATTRVAPTLLGI